MFLPEHLPGNAAAKDEDTAGRVRAMISGMPPAYIAFVVVPEPGDVVIRNIANQSFEVVDPLTSGHLAGPVFIVRARIRGPLAKYGQRVWQQVIDNRDRVKGDPIVLPQRAHGVQDVA